MIQLKNNRLEDWSNVSECLTKLSKLRCVWLNGASNAISTPEHVYRRRALLLLPQLTHLDGLPCRDNPLALPLSLPHDPTTTPTSDTDTSTTDTN